MVASVKDAITAKYGIELTEQMYTWLAEFEKGDRNGTEHEGEQAASQPAAEQAPPPTSSSGAMPRPASSSTPPPEQESAPRGYKRRLVVNDST